MFRAKDNGPTLHNRIEQALAQRPDQVEALSGGCIGEVYRAQLPDGEQIVVKVDDGEQPKLDVEGFMLQYLADHSALPVPEVYFSSPQLLIMAYLPGSSRFSGPAQRHAAELLAALHGVSASAYGFERDTLIGGVRQPNPWTESWLSFFGEQRLLYMAQQGEEAGRLPVTVRRRVEQLCGRLERWLAEPEAPALLHGDVWTTNVLATEERIVGFLDPAIYFGHPEIELAFTTLFGTFEQPFFRRYQEIKEIEPGFFEERRDLYNLYPLLVHVRLFGGSYVQSVTRILQRFGF